MLPEGTLKDRVALLISQESVIAPALAGELERLGARVRSATEPPDLDRVDICIYHAAEPAGDMARALAAVTAAHACLQAVGGQMVSREQPGSLLLITPAAPAPAVRDHAAAAVAQAGLVALARQAALEWAPHNVRCNVLVPGFLAGTHPDHLRAHVPARRLGKPAEVAHLAAYLVSEFSDYMTGQVLILDGAVSLSPVPFGIRTN